MGGNWHTDKVWFVILLEKRTGHFFLSTGSKWKTRRRIITPAFHDRALLYSFINIFNKQANVFVERLSSLYNGKPKQEVNLYPYIASCTLDIICGKFFPVHFNHDFF
jgi:cytochrome P450